MLKSEFFKGVKANDNEANNALFEEAERVYMSSDLSKERIYELYAPLVNNELTAYQIAFNERLNDEIADLQARNTGLKETVNSLQYFIGTEGDPEWIKIWRGDIKRYRWQIKKNNERIKFLLSLRYTPHYYGED